MLELIGFDGDDTLWHSESYYQAAHEEFADIVARYVDMDDGQLQRDMLAAERRNLKLFGYGAKGMTLSMVETAISLTGARISAEDIHRLIAIGKDVLRHPVDLLPGIREVVQAVAAEHRVVLITKGDLFHQEQKVARSGLADLFHRVEIVSEKDPDTYRRVLEAMGVVPARFAMVGNSLRSDIQPVLHMGGWAVHMPYHVTWAHELEARIDGDARCMLEVRAPEEIPLAIRQLRDRAAAAA